MIDMLPGSYLYQSRIRSLRGLASYAWLEIFPSFLAGWLVQGAERALWFVLSHWAMLGLYELGYVGNDRASTARERRMQERAGSAAPSAPLVLSRVLQLVVVTGALALRFGLQPALQFAGLSLALVALLFVHTWAGVRIGFGAPVRIVTFAWLAAFKYLPGNFVSLGSSLALRLCLVLFLFYGAGRVLEYALEKHGACVLGGLMGVNAAWFVAALPLAWSLSAVVSAPMLLACLAALGSHHLLTIVVRALPRPDAFSESDAAHAES